MKSDYTHVADGTRRRPQQPGEGRTLILKSVGVVKLSLHFLCRQLSPDARTVNRQCPSLRTPHRLSLLMSKCRRVREIGKVLIDTTDNHTHRVVTEMYVLVTDMCVRLHESYLRS